MTETLSTPDSLDRSRSTRSTIAVFSAMLGWALFFVVPALLFAAIDQGLRGGPDDHSASIVAIMLAFAAISVMSAVVGMILGGTKTRVACLVLLCCQAYPLIARNNFLF
ncbi:hypothetical protein [Williamsia maris]|nr:hypothetical protein [Williamsia maris]